MEKEPGNHRRPTLDELDVLSRCIGSSVFRINHSMRSCLDPTIFDSTPELLREHIYDVKAGKYDCTMDGMVLDFRNTQYVGINFFVPGDDSCFDYLINADWYVFRPVEQSMCSGIIQRVGDYHMELLIYGIVKARVVFQRMLNKPDFPKGARVYFRIKSCSCMREMVYMYGLPPH